MATVAVSRILVKSVLRAGALSAIATLDVGGDNERAHAGAMEIKEHFILLFMASA